ncbi:M12 family metallo-peptidase, partial [Bacteroidota bacterium]
LKWILFLLIINISFAKSELNKISVKAEELFTYPASIEYVDSKSKLPGILSENDEAKPVNINQEFAETIFNTETDVINISNFPVAPGEYKTISLNKSKPAVGLGTRWIRKTAEGEETASSFEPQFYTGKISGIENSKVTVFYNLGYMYSIVEQEGYDNYSIAPLIGVSDKEAHILASQGSSSPGKDFNPFLDLQPLYENNEINYDELIKNADKIQSTDLLQADIIIEATSDFYRLFNDYDKTATYIAAVMTHTSQLYEENVYISLFVPLVVIHEDRDTDPYKSTTQIYDRLYQLRDYWRKRTTKRAIVCLMTDIDYQGGSGGYRVGGVSLGLGTLCKNNRGYCVFGMQGHYKYPTSNYTWDVSVSAHELGHAFGSPHTHNCYFLPNMIDTCITRNKPQADSDGCVTTGNPIPRPGTLMSYCHLTNSTRSVGLYFHERVKPIIRGFAEQASCVRLAVDPVLILLQPNGGNVLFPGDEVKIKWASNQVEYVAIKYSLDNGNTWQWVEPYAEALSGEVVWTVPDTMTTSLKIMIQDSYNSYVFDETDLALSIDTPHFLLLEPVENARLGQNEIFDINWEQKYLDNFIIKFTSQGSEINYDNEDIWTEIASGISGYSYEWNVPNIESQECMLKITGSTENGGEFEQYSGIFAIGKEFCEIIAPEPGEKICAGIKYDLKWNSDYVSDFYIQYSTNGGEKWRHVKFSPINGFDGSYTWKIPDYFSDSCLIRFAPYANKDNILAELTEYYTIDSCETAVELYQNKSENSGLVIKELVPNPANYNIKLTFDYRNSAIKPVDIYLIDDKGSSLNIGSFTNINSGENSFNIKLPNIAQGNYYLVIQSGNQRAGKKLFILR